MCQKNWECVWSWKSSFIGNLYDCSDQNCTNLGWFVWYCCSRQSNSSSLYWRKCFVVLELLIRSLLCHAVSVDRTPTTWSSEDRNQWRTSNKQIEKFLYREYMPSAWQVSFMFFIISFLCLYELHFGTTNTLKNCKQNNYVFPLHSSMEGVELIGYFLVFFVANEDNLVILANYICRHLLPTEYTCKFQVCHSFLFQVCGEFMPTFSLFFGFLE